MVVGASAIAMLIVAALAAVLPAIRVARVDPLTAIRSE
jgi:ABC-type antimicrobial peptide transport system permease subunit